MGWGVFGGSAVGSSINLSNNFTLKSANRIGASLETIGMGQGIAQTDNIALSLNEHLNDFSMATKAKDYKQFSFRSFNQAEIAAAIENPSNRIHFNFQ
jgi:hypothetical protein